MRIRIIAVGQKMPVWVDQGYNEYAKRINGDCRLELLELPMQKRAKNSNILQLKEKEGKSIIEVLKASERLVVLDVIGKAMSTEQLAEEIRNWQMDGRDVTLIIGGPDGLSDQVLNKANNKISLSKLTLPHPLVRVIIAEQLYRAWSLNQGHPYHRP